MKTIIVIIAMLLTLSVGAQNAVRNLPRDNNYVKLWKGNSEIGVIHPVFAGNIKLARNNNNSVEFDHDPVYQRNLSYWTPQRAYVRIGDLIDGRTYVVYGRMHRGR